MDFRTYILSKKYTDKVVTESGLKGADGKDGANGKSAYEYAVDGGYTGTEEEFTQAMASSSLEVFTVDAYSDLPIEGNKLYVYRVINEAKLYQWNGTKYEPLESESTELNIQIINGGNASGNE